MSSQERRLYRISFQPDDPDQWYLGSPMIDGSHVAANLFTRCERYARPSIPEFPVVQQGEPRAFSFATHGCPVVTEAVATLVEALAPDDVDRIPARIGGSPERREVLNACVSIDCLDRDRSGVDLYPAGHARAGRIKSVMSLRLHVEPTLGHHLFRVEGWMVALIVSDQLKAAFEAHSVTSVK